MPTSPPTRTSLMVFDPIDGRCFYFDPEAPDYRTITVGLLAQGLPERRFGGFTTRPISVAEHSIGVMLIAQALVGDRMNSDDLRTLKIAALLHDAHEALVAWGDCASPGKTAHMEVVEARVDAAIRKAFGLDVPPICDVVVKVADAIALCFEATECQPRGAEWSTSIAKRSIGWVNNPGLNPVAQSVVDVTGMIDDERLASIKSEWRDRWAVASEFSDERRFSSLSLSLGKWRGAWAHEVKSLLVEGERGV